MRICFLAALLAITHLLQAQRDCSSFEYQQQQLAINPALKTRLGEIENFVQEKLNSINTAAKPHAGMVFTIPVVVHILYNKAEENISDERVISQLKVLNERFRRLHADTVNTPAAFKSLAADCGIEFRLAIADPQRRATTGIIRKYTPVAQWKTDDQMKFSSRAGNDAWDPEHYLNIWVCNMPRTAGYSSFPGGPAETDGIVIACSVFGINNRSGYEMGKTAVHEAGHWLGLRHIWGDDYCGDDWVDDTPKQANFTSGCPSGIRPSCNSGPNGDMYMNYMDITYDACTNLFTEGQKDRMRAYFVPGGERYSILSSYGLQPPLITEKPLPEELPRWTHPQLYPNPATNELILDLSYDIRWIGATIMITNAQGQHITQQAISSKVVKIDVNKLRPGLYLLVAKRTDGAIIKEKFIKM